MNQYIIKGGRPLVGEVTIGGAKNAALGILGGAIMADEPVLIDNLPNVNDVNVLLDAIAGIGATVERIDEHTVRINGKTITSKYVDYEYIKKIRGSYYLLGSLLGKYNEELHIIKSHIDNDSDEESSDYIKNLFNKAGEYRNSFK